MLPSIFQISKTAPFDLSDKSCQLVLQIFIRCHHQFFQGHHQFVKRVTARYRSELRLNHWLDFKPLWPSYPIPAYDCTRFDLKLLDANCQIVCPWFASNDCKKLSRDVCNHVALSHKIQYYCYLTSILAQKTYTFLCVAL